MTDLLIAAALTIAIIGTTILAIEHAPSIGNLGALHIEEVLGVGME